MAFDTQPGWGLVLSGGGARGAYEVGVVRYLAEAGFAPTMFGGASIGALNAAVLAAAADFQTGADTLIRVWEALESDEVLRLKNPAGPATLDLALALALLRSTAPASLAAAGLLAGLGPAFAAMPAVMAAMRAAEGGATALERGVLDVEYLQRLLDAEVGSDAGAHPLWISVYRTQGALIDILRVGLAEVGGPDTPPSEFVHFQSLPREERLEALLASAALPIAFGKRRFGGTDYRDGGIGIWRTSEGNTPLRPLAENGCKACVVVHLSDGSMWDRHRFGDVAVIEVRPEQELHSEGALQSLINFDRNRLRQWMEQGYEDAARCVGRSVNALGLKHAASRSQIAAQRGLAALAADRLDDALTLPGDDRE